jgi:GAF domain-containing protein
MADQALLLRALSEFAHTLVGRYDVADVLYQLAERVTEVLDVAGAGVSLGEGDGVRFVTGINAAVVRVEETQEEAQDGPCTEAFRTGKIVTASDLREVTGKWEAVIPVALAAGFLSVAAIPMAVEGQALGALNIYSAQLRQWSDDDLTAAGVLADMATSYIISASELEKSRRTAEQLEQALESRLVIEQAKGMLAADGTLSVDQAFEKLRSHARAHNASLRSVAEAVVNLGLRPH